MPQINHPNSTWVPMEQYKKRVVATADFLRSNIHTTPRIGLRTGTGLGDIAEALILVRAFGYDEIPHFPLSTVQSHRGRLLIGSLEEKPLIAMQGRFHLYEGYSPLEVAFPIRVMQEIGVEQLIISNAAGGLNPGYHQGDIMLIQDHINLTGANPLVGRNEETWGPRFPDMTQAYDRHLLEIAESAASDLGFPIQKGVYAGLLGPSLETPAETRLLRQFGADAVGLSTVMEVIAAVHAQMKVLGISVLANINNPDKMLPITAEDVIATANATAPKMVALIRKVVENLD
jgi:purine-nucleoside phosphorylase